MGGRVKRSDGYNVDDFVRDNSEVEHQSSETEYVGSDSDGSVEVKAASKPKANTSGKVQTNKKPASKDASIRAVTPKPVFEKAVRLSARKAKTLFTAITEHDELDEVIGAETEDEVFDSDVSDFEADIFQAVGSKDSDSGAERKERKKGSQANQTKDMLKTPSPSKPAASLLTPPSTNGKRARDEQDTNENSGDDSTSSPCAAKRTMTHANPLQRRRKLSELSEQFGLRRTAKVDKEQEYPKVEDDIDGPYYV